MRLAAVHSIDVNSYASDAIEVIDNANARDYGSRAALADERGGDGGKGAERDARRGAPAPEIVARPFRFPPNNVKASFVSHSASSLRAQSSGVRAAEARHVTRETPKNHSCNGKTSFGSRYG